MQARPGCYDRSMATRRPGAGQDVHWAVAFLLGIGLAAQGCGDRSGLLLIGDAAHPVTPAQAVDAAPVQAGESSLPSSPSCLAPALTPTVVFDSPSSFIGHLAIDGDAVYFTDSVPGDADVTRVSKCGGHSEPLDDGRSSRGPAQSLAVAPPNLAWIDLVGIGAQIFTVPTTSPGGARNLFATELSAADTIAIDAERVYFVAGPGIQSVALVGGAVNMVAPGDHFLVAIDDARVYAVETPPTGEALVSAPKSGGATTVLVSTPHATRIFLDDSDVYWIAWNDNGSNSSIMRVSKAGGTASVVAAGQDAPGDIAVDGTHVYWTTGSGGTAQALVRRPKTGGVVETLYAGTSVGGVVLDSRSVYWSALHTLMRLDK
jgi:hypothetical protein